MSAFFGGIVFGGLLTAAVLILFLGKLRRPRNREPIDWQAQTYEPPVITHVTHQSINRIREINL